jgi:hypothetical protein
MFVPMVCIRKVSMVMGQGLVTVNMVMRFARGRIAAMPIRVIVMLIMAVLVGMSCSFVHMAVTVAFAQVQPEA